VGEARDEPERHRIGCRGEDNRNRAGGLAGCQGGAGESRHNDIHLQTDELGQDMRELVILPPDEAVLQEEILPFHVAEVAQGVPEYAPVRIADAHNPDPGDFPRQLGVGCQRRHQDAERQGHEPPRDVRPHSYLLGAACCPLPCRSVPVRMGVGCAHAT
jgi:hypothetical protein